MLREVFLGRPLSHFTISPVIKAFIVSETFLWSAFNAIVPIFAIFAATKIPGGNAEIAASAFSTYLIVRVIFELISGKFLSKSDDTQKLVATIAGMIFISLGYIGFAQTTTILPLFIFYGVVGVGLGIASPPKNALFSSHLDKNRDVAEWGIYDATVFMGMALSAALGGFIATRYGFHFLFLLVAVTNLLGIIPYLLYLNKKGY